VRQTLPTGVNALAVVAAAATPVFKAAAGPVSHSAVFPRTQIKSGGRSAT